MGPKKKRDQLSSVDSPTTAKNVGHTSQKGEKTGDVKKQNRSTAKSRPSPKASSVEKSKGTKPRGGHESQKRQPNSPNRQYSDDAGPSMTGKKQAENESGSKKQLRPIDKSQTIHDDMPNGSDSGTNSKRRARIHDRHNQKQKFLQKMHQSQTSQAIFRQSGTRPKLTQSIPPQRVTGTVVDNRGNGDEDYSDEEEEEEDPKYRKRDVESNWNRYEIPNDESSTSSDDSSDSFDALQHNSTQRSCFERIVDTRKDYVTSSPKQCIESKATSDYQPCNNIFYVPTFAKDDFDQDVHPEDSTTTELKNDLDDFLRTTQTKVRNLALNNITIPTVTLASMEKHPFLSTNILLPQVPETPHQSIEDWLNEALNF